MQLISFFISTLRVSFIFVLLLSAGSAISQEKKSKKERKAEKQAKIDEMIRLEEEGTIVYPKQNIFGFHLYSDGWGAMYEKGKQKNTNKATLYSIEFGERKHPKEVKLYDASSGGGFIFGQPLIYGKENNFFFLKLGVGQSYLIGGKGNKNGVSVSAVYKGGLSLGLLKPYYVDVVDPITSQIVAAKYEGGDGKYDNEFLSNPLGSSGVFKGAGETQIKPGLFLKGALRFDYGRYNEIVSAIETGFGLEYYASEMPIMIRNEPQRSFINVFVAIEFGRRK
ncbi:MAG: hypothetical protein MUE71_11730 [Chitinophagaceae bacterium]|jgi:hypothetical protein|nr:hypothetical protein [Chitinophagaceae bacterium]